MLTAAWTDGSLSVTVPLDALGAGVTSIDVSVEPVADTVALTDAVAAPQGTVIVAGQAYDIDITDDQGNALTQFSPPLTLTFTVDPLVTDPADVVVFLYDAATGEWVLVDPSLVTASVDGTITVIIDHLTLLALFVDTEAPVLTPPADITLATETPAESVPIDHPDIAAFLAGASAEDALDGPVVVTNGAPAEFSIGSTLVAFFATDGAGNTATAVATVTVVSGELGAPLAFQNIPPQGDFACGSGMAGSRSLTRLPAWRTRSASSGSGMGHAGSCTCPGCRSRSARTSPWSSDRCCSWSRPSPVRGIQERGALPWPDDRHAA